MHIRILALAALACSIASAGCGSQIKESPPYSSEAGLTFEIDDGTGIFYSKSKSYLPVYCSTNYPIRKMDIGQDNFDAIAGLVTAGDIWHTKVVGISQCQVIDVGLPGQYFKFETHDKSVTIKVGQCQRVDSAHEPYLKAIRQIVRTVSDRQKLYVSGECIRI